MNCLPSKSIKCPGLRHTSLAFRDNALSLSGNDKFSAPWPIMTNTSVSRVGKRRFSVSDTFLFSMAFIILCALASSCGSTQRLLEPEPDWVFLAQRKVSHIRETDVFKIKNRDKFAALKLYVYNRSITIKRVEVLLINGDRLTPSFDTHINAGDRSRIIELSSDGRQVEKITIRYKSEGKLFTDKALVQVAGLRVQDPRR